MTLDIRFGRTEDADAIVGFILQAGNGIFEHLFEGLLPTMKARDIIRLAVTDEQSPLNVSNAIIVEEGGKALGCIVFYPAEEYGLPPVISTILPGKRLDPLRALFESSLPGSLYINTVAVAPDTQGRGIGRLLVETVVGYAEETGATALSLHAWLDNEPAVALYRSMGFETIEDITVGASSSFPSYGRLALMRATVRAASTEAG